MNNLYSTASILDAAVMAKNWHAYITPGEPHKKLANLSGSWKEEITIWMHAETPPQSSSATSENKMILNGLYQEVTHKGTINGMAYEGLCITGFDNAKKKYVMTWIDNMGSGAMQQEGHWDEETNTINLEGITTDAMTGNTLAVRQALIFNDAKNYTIEMYETKNGKERKTMEIIFTRIS